MQYVLSQAEYDELKAKKTVDFKMKTDKLQKLCTKIADTMPVKWGWGPPYHDVDGISVSQDIPKPWGCVLSTHREWYCDTCPVTEICPYPDKHWSK